MGHEYIDMDVPDKFHIGNRLLKKRTFLGVFLLSKLEFVYLEPEVYAIHSNYLKKRNTEYVNN